MMNDFCPRIKDKCILATYYEGKVLCGANVSAYSRFVNNKGLLYADKISEKVDCATEKIAKKATKDIRLSKSSEKQ